MSKFVTLIGTGAAVAVITGLVFAYQDVRAAGFANGLDVGRQMQLEVDQKQMVDLECAHYDPKTAAFTTNSCALTGLANDAVMLPEQAPPPPTPIKKKVRK